MTENYIIPTLESVTAVPEKALATSALLNQRFDKVNELLALIREALKFATADDVANGTQSVYPDAAQVLAGIQAHGFKASNLAKVWEGEKAGVYIPAYMSEHPINGLYLISWDYSGSTRHDLMPMYFNPSKNIYVTVIDALPVGYTEPKTVKIQSVDGIFSVRMDDPEGDPVVQYLNILEIHKVT